MKRFAPPRSQSSNVDESPWRPAFPCRSHRTGWKARPPLAFLAAIIVAVTASVAFAADPGPESSIKAPLAVKSLLLDLARAGNAIVAVGERGHILVSRDAGATWTQSDVPTQSMLTAIVFHDAKLGWAVGHDAVILRTKDGGTSWERVHWAPEDEAPFLDVWFADANNGIAIGAYGRCFVTADGGTTWAQRTVAEEDLHLNEIAAAGGNRLYIAGESGQVFRSDDAGTTWKQLDSGYTGSFFGLLPLESESLLVFGLRGHLFRTDDGGATWQKIDTGVQTMLNSAVRLADGTIVVVGLGGTVLVSKDGGRSFTLHQQATRGGITSVVDAGNGKIVMTGEFGVRTVSAGDLVK